MVIPVAIGLLNTDGSEAVPTQILTLTRETQSFTFTGLNTRPIPSLLRGFSAPVILQRSASQAERLTLLAHDTDMFNRFEASRELGRATLINMLCNDGAPDEGYSEALLQVLANEGLEPGFRAICCALPGQDEIAQALVELGHTPDPVVIYHAHEKLSHHLATSGRNLLRRIYQTHAVKGPYTSDAISCGHRALANLALRYISLVDGAVLAAEQFDIADNMTLQMPALANLMRSGKGDHAVQKFYTQWRHERLVIDKWFSLQVSNCNPSQAVSIAKSLLLHHDFSLKNPNRFRSLIGALAMTPAAFHQPDGSAYDLVADQLIALDDLNPQLCARMTTVFETWQRYNPSRQAMMRAALLRIEAKPRLSRDTREMVSRLLKT